MKVKSIIIATSLLVIGGLTSSFFISDVANALGELWFLSSNNVRPNVSTWGIQVPSLSNCNTIDTDSNGIFSCGTDSGGVSNWQFIGPNAVRPTTTVGIIINASSTISQVLNLDNYLSFTATSTPTTPAANHLSVYAEMTQGHTKLVWLDDDGIAFTIGQDNTVSVKNTSGSTINKGQAVYITGSTGNVPNIGLAKADSTTTLPAFGVAAANILNNAFGEVMLLGKISSIDTSSFTSGDRVFVSPTTAGSLTNVRPPYPYYAQRMGSVMVSGVGNGSLEISTAPFIGGEESWTSAAGGFTAKSLTISANGSATTTIASGISTFAGGLISQASSTFNGSITALGGFNGNASTADALFVNPTDCTNQFANAIAASGNLTCASVVDAYVDFTALTLADFTNDSNFWTTTSASSWLNSSSTLAIDIVGNLTGNADTATALAANGANCTDQFPLGVNTLGAVESCTTITTAYMDLTTITLADFTNDGDYFKWANATSTYLPLRGGTITGLTVTYGISAATSTITATSTASSLAVGTSNLYVSQNGKVGIGTVAPASALDVNGTITIRNQFDVNANDINNINSLRGRTDAVFNINPNTNLTDATEQTLNIRTLNATSNAWVNAITLSPSGANPSVYLLPAGTGNVGIGTTTPAALLTVGATGSGFKVASDGNSVTGMFLYPAFTYTTTTWEGATTTIPLGVAYENEEWTAGKCFTNAGTLILTFGDGTNYTNRINASTTVGEVAFTSNNTFTPSEKRYVQIGSPASSPTEISCTIKKKLK